MLVSDVAEEPGLSFGREHGRAQGVDWRISEPLVMEAAVLVQPVEVLFVLLGAEEAQIADLEVAEELAVVVLESRLRVQQPVQVRLGMDELGVGGDEMPRLGPQRGEGACVVEDVHVEAVF